MKASSYLSFNGNCAEAILLYEKAFNVKADYCYYKDTPPSEGYQLQEGTENFIMHGQFNIGDSSVMVCDTTPNHKTNFGNGISIHVSMDNMENAQSAFDILKEGGIVTMELQPTFWAKCFGLLEDKFGINWMISIEE